MRIDPGVEDAIWVLRDFLYAKVYDNLEVHGDFIRAEKIIKDLFKRLMEDDQLYAQRIGPPPAEEERRRALADYIAGMTDHFAMRLYQDVFWPRPWAGMDCFKGPSRF